MDIQIALFEMEQTICEQMILTSLCSVEQLKLSKRHIEVSFAICDSRPPVAFEYDGSNDVYVAIRK